MKIKLLLIITSVLLSVLPKVNFGQAPDLGTAAGFVLFSSNGAVTNTGTSTITGNVGAQIGAVSGFGNVNGQMHSGDDSTMEAAADLLVAYNQLDAAIPTMFPSSTLGNGQTLTAGIYSIAGTTTLNGGLTLDAQGNANAVFIIQIEGAFSTNAASKVYLVNGAQACKVFWKVEGKVDMATGTSMKGNIIANNAEIVMAANDTLEGRALSTTGAISVNSIMAYTPIGCGSPVLTGPAAPDLGTVACYALFSSGGEVTNDVNPTYVTGDIGTNTGLTTGYNPLFVTGTIHPIPDASTAQAALDLDTAYNYLNTLPYDIQLMFPAQFGNDLVLTPHTYWLNAATVLTSTLYLDAQGDSNAVFVIQINGAFSTATNSEVVLLNGTQAKNVFWKIDGAVDLNEYSIFSGTMVANNGAMSLKTGVTMDGRALTTTGALLTTAMTANIPSGCGAGVAANIITQPVNKTVCTGSLATFSVTATGTGLTYQWRKGTTNIVNGGNISGATTATLKINPANTGNAATNYNVVITGDVSDTTSNNVSLIVNTAPAFTTMPTNQTACVDSAANFTVVATGTGLTYQWRKGTVNLVNGGNISGATTATLTFDPANSTDVASNYNVIISGTCSPKDTSANVSLSINNNPEIILDPVDQSACVDSAVSFTVGATGTGLTYQWRKGTVNLVNGGNISGATTATLTIDPMSVSDTSSNYNVIVTGTCSSVSTDASVSLSLCNPDGIVDAEAGNNSVSIYPNPFTTSLSIIRNDASGINNLELTMYNVLGEMVLNTPIAGQSVTVGTNNLPSGIYFYKVIMNNKTVQSGRLIAQ